MSAKHAAITPLLCLVILMGCGPSGPLPRPAGFPVSGKVLTASGSPLAGGTLILRPTDRLYGATSIIQADGSFSLQDGSGNKEIVAGQYQVFVSFPNPEHASLATSVNKRYQESEDGDSDVVVDLQQPISDLTIRLKR